MIGSHDTFTYLPSTCWAFNHAKRWWKCQCNTINEQYAFGIRFFDIRVARHNGKWHFAHGLVTLKSNIDSIRGICSYMQKAFPEAIYRIVLERGDATDELRFIQETNSLYKEFPNLWRVDIKREKVWMGKYGNNNEYLYHKGYKFAKVNTWEKPAYELHGTLTKNNWYKMNLRKEAKKINSNLLFFQDKEGLIRMMESKNELYFLDYATNEY